MTELLNCDLLAAWSNVCWLARDKLIYCTELRAFMFELEEVCLCAGPLYPYCIMSRELRAAYSLELTFEYKAELCLAELLLNWSGVGGVV